MRNPEGGQRREGGDGRAATRPPFWEWPFTGREETVSELTTLLADDAGPGLLITGPAGVGKTRLARELLAGRQVLAAPATESAAEIPFGALAHLLPAELPAAGARPNLLRVLADALLADIPSRDARDAARPVLFVDDAHLLDDGSAALVLHVAARGGPRIVITARSGVPLPDAVAALLRGGYATPVELPPIGPDAVGRLLERALGGQVETATAHRLRRGSGGNVLWLQLLVEAGLAAGTLAAVADVWRWRGEAFQLSTRLVDLVRQRIGQLAPQERRAAELLALGEPLGVAVLERLVGAGALDELDRRDLIAGEEDGRRALIRLAHPLYREVLRQRMPPHRRRHHSRDLATATERSGLRRRGDLARVGTWRLAAGDTSDPGLLLAAADHAILTLDFALAARLAEAACQADGGAPARRALAVALGFTGEGARAEQVHRQLPFTVTPDREQLRSVQLRAANLYLALDRPADAIDLLRRAEDAVAPDDPAAAAELAAFQALLHAVQADWQAVAHALERAGKRGAPGPRTTVRMRYAECVDHFCHGRTDAALDVIASTLPILPSDDDMPLIGTGLMSWLATVQTYAGQLDDAEATALAQYQRAREKGWVGSQGAWQVYLGRIAARRGHLRTARRHMREGLATLREDTTWGQHALPLGEWATVQAQLGDTATARKLLDQSHLARVESYRCLHVLAFQMAGPWILAAQGRLRDAAQRAVRAAADVRRRDMPLWEAELLHLPVRLGQTAPVANRLTELAAIASAPHIAIYAEHAAACAARDADAAATVSTAFEHLGLLLHAAEAAAHAARLWSRRDSPLAQTAADRCHRLSRRCEGVATPSILACWTPGLTDRERDIARLAAQGASSEAIATHLGIAVRTVDNHLYRVYRKTGVTSRRELWKVLAGDAKDAGADFEP